PATLVSAHQMCQAVFTDLGALTTRCSVPPGRPQSWTYQAWTSNVATQGPLYTVMQPDGALVTFRGTDPGHGLGQVWSSNSGLRPPGGFAAVIHDDGTLAVPPGTAPATTAPPVWANGGLDPHATYVRNDGGTQQITRDETNSVAGWTPVAPLR